MSTNEVIFEIDQEILDGIKKTFADRSHVEVGILSGAGGVASIGAVHEFGSVQAMTPGKLGYFYGHFGIRKTLKPMTIPARSFLRKTVANKGEDFISWMQGQSETLLQFIVTGTWPIALQMFGWKWKNYVKECFATRGFGQWAPLSALTVMDKGHDTPLIRTGRLEASIDSQVVEK